MTSSDYLVMTSEESDDIDSDNTMFSQDMWRKRAICCTDRNIKLMDKIKRARYDIDKLNKQLSELRILNNKQFDMLNNYISTINELKQQTPILHLTPEDLMIIGVDRTDTSKKEIELGNQLKTQINQIDQLKTQINKLNKKSIGEMLHNEELVRKLQYQQKQTSEANARIELLELDLLKKSNTQTISDLNLKIKCLESELRRKTEHSNNIETELKSVKELADNLYRTSFQQSLDLRRAEDRASDEYRMRTDAENILISHSIYR